MRRRWSLAVLAALSVLARPLAPQAAEPLPTTEIAPGVHVYEAPIALADRVNLGAVANLGFVVGDEAVAVIDTGGSRAAGERLLAAIRARTDLPIRYVLNTHVHPDHILGNAAFADIAGVEFVGHANLPQAMAGRHDTYLASNRALIGDAFAGTTIVAPTLTVDTRRVLDLGGRTLIVETWPTAHSNTDLTVFDDRSGTWFLGDLLFVRHLPVVDGKLKGWLATLSILRARPAGRAVPGHGPAAVAWPEAAAPMARYLERLQADLRAMIRSGRPLADAAREAGRDASQGWLLVDDFAARNATTAFQELEWE